MPSLLEALERKYGERCADLKERDIFCGEEGISISIFVPCKSPRALVPSLLVLNDCDITTAGEKEALIQKCAGVEELDLAKNKLNDWPEVFCILQQMPRLKFVNLSFNKLSMPIVERLDLHWEQLRNLVLNSTYVKWRSVRKMLNHLPCLEELHLSLNDYEHVHLWPDEDDCNCQIYANDTDVNKESNEYSGCRCPKFEENEPTHNNLKRLHFTGNPVIDWKEISKLGYAFPNLQSLVLAECPIKSLSIEDECSCFREYQRSESECESSPRKSSPHDSFRNLMILNLNTTELASWDEIERLSKFPSLECVRIQGCPLWESNEYTEHERRQLLIARLPNVKTLNGGGAITHDEREDAERAFIRYYMEKAESDRPERYFDLVGIHGKLDPLVNVDLRPEKRVKVTFTCGTNSEARCVDVYRTVCDLKSKLEAFAGFSASKMRLFYVDQDLRDIQGPEEMKYPHKQLYSYNIRSGDEIIIDCKKKGLDKSIST